MAHVAVHALVYIVANGLLIALWIALGGDPAVLDEPLEAARQEGFWPLWPALGWGAILAVHAGVTAIIAARGGASTEDDDTPRREWIAVAFVDVVDSTPLAEELGDEEWSERIVGLRRTARERAAQHDGDEVGTQGDGLLLRFASPRDALRCAARLQDDLAPDGDASPELVVRIGIHAGHAMRRDGDVLGQMVNVASRVADQAGPGEVLVTEPVAEQADPGARFEDRGLVGLSGIDSPRHLLRFVP